jgi:tellurite resistance protein TerC
MTLPPLPFAFFEGPLPWLILAGVTVVCLWVDLHFFARGREPSFREGVVWSIGWLVFSLLIAVVVLVLSDADDAITYTTVYFIERSLSLDNLFVFLLLFSYFGIPEQYRARLLFWGIAAALVLRGLAILGGVALIEQFHFVIYILGVLLLVLAYRILQGVDENVDPDKNFIVRMVRRFFPVTPDDHGGHWFVTIDGTKYVTPIFLCLSAIVAADIAFAVDSIPAAFAITRDSVLIWMGNVFALLGLRALFVLVEGLIRRFRYLDETIAIVLALVAVKLLIEDIYKIGPVASLGIVAAAFAIGIIASIVADRRDPDADAKRAERSQRTTRSAEEEGGEEPSAGDEPGGEPEPEEAATRPR